MFTSGLIKLVEVYCSDAEGLCMVDNLGWELTGSDVNHVVSILARCAARSIELVGSRGLQFHMAETEAAQFTHR